MTIQEIKDIVAWEGIDYLFTEVYLEDIEDPRAKELLEKARPLYKELCDLFIE